MLIAKIDVTKIDKARLLEGKNGAKYLDIVLLETPDNQYGNSHMIRQAVSKEEREKGVKGNILGNAKELSVGGSRRQSPKPPTPSASGYDSNDPVPF